VQIALNSEQQKAVTHQGSALLVIAGPGSGKTRVIVERVENLTKNGIPSENILCLTFTQKAAGEMQERLETKGIMNAIVSTYHSFCRDLCAENAEATGIGKTTKIIPKSSMLVWCMKNTDSFKFDTTVLDVSGDLISIYTAMHEGISNFKEEMITPDALEKWLDSEQKKLESLSEKEKAKKENLARQEYVSRHREFNKVYKKYLEYEKEKLLIDYDDMINRAITLLKTSKLVQAECREKFKYILVDEFQDNNYAQFELLKLLANDGNVTVVGDEDQLIYSFQGASPNNFTSFQDFFSPVKIVYLEENYRSTKNIVDTAKLLLPKDNSKKLYSNLEKGEPVHIVRPDTDEAEVEFVLETIQNLIGTKFTHRTRGPSTIQYKDIAILSRKKETGDLFAQVLKSYNIPSIYVGNFNIFTSPIIRELLDYLKATSSPSTNGQTLFKIMERQGIEDRNIRIILEEAQKIARNVAPGSSDYVYEKMKECNSFDITQKPEVLEVVELIEKLRKEMSKNNLIEFLRKVTYEMTGIFQRCIQTDTLESRRNIAILNAFYESVLEFFNLNPDGTIKDFLEHMSYLDKFELDFEEATTDEDSVQIMTMHKSKGKEFPVVFITDVVQGRFPPSYRTRKYFPPGDLLQGKDKMRHSKEKHVQEEKRLLYVGMSRAQNQLFVLAPKRYEGNLNEKKVSEFLNDIDYDKRPEIIKTYEYKGKGILQDTPTEYVERIKKEKQHEAALAIDQMALTTAAHKLIHLARIKYFEEHRKDDPHCKNFDPMKVFEINLSQVSLDQDLNGNIPPLFNEKNLTLSPTSIETYLDCPFQFKLNRMRVPGPNRTYFDLGTSIHNTIQEVSETKKDKGKLLPKDEVEKILDNKWIFRTFESNDQESVVKTTAKELIEKYLDMEQKSKNKIVGVEEEFAITRNNVVINGKIDRIEENSDGEYELLDFKTSKTFKKPDELETDIQLNMYAAAMRDISKFKKLPVKATLVYLRDKPVECKITQQNVDLVMARVDETIQNILQGNFEATPSNSVCRNCSYNEMCEFAER